jgi:hypothetical protein
MIFQDLFLSLSFLAIKVIEEEVGEVKRIEIFSAGKFGCCYFRELILGGAPTALGRSVVDSYGRKSVAPTSGVCG